MSRHVSYWLTPAEPDRTRWGEIVRSLAQQLDAPIFEPHVTLYSARLHPRDRPDEIIHGATREISGIVLNATGIGRTEQFTKTLFIEFALTEALVKLGGELKRLSTHPDEYDLKPHLSLVYAKLARDVTQRLAKDLPVPSCVRFDTVKAMVSQGPTRTRADVEAWQIVAVAKLAK